MSLQDSYDDAMQAITNLSKALDDMRQDRAQMIEKLHTARVRANTLDLELDQARASISYWMREYNEKYEQLESIHRVLDHRTTAPGRESKGAHLNALERLTIFLSRG